MIPKIAWLHWDGPEMSWLRKRGIETFRKHNPDWDLRVVDTPAHMAGLGLCKAHEADWNRWRLLAEYGGLALDTDIIHLNPLPDEWLYTDLCAQLGSSGHVYQMPVIGGVPGNSLFIGMEKYCERNLDRVASHNADPFDPDDDVYQEFGIVALKSVIGATGPPQLQHDRRDGTPRKDSPQNIYKFGTCTRVPLESFCFFNWDTGPAQLWSEYETDIPKDTIGVHWYGGAKVTKKREPASSPDGKSWIERMAR